MPPSPIIINEAPLITSHCLFLPYQQVNQSAYEVFKHREKFTILYVEAGTGVHLPKTGADICGTDTVYQVNEPHSDAKFHLY